MLAKKLKKWDTIWIVTPSKPISPSKKIYIDNCIDYLNSIWLNTKFSDNALGTDKYWISCGTRQQKANDINNMFEDKSINAIWAVQWWYTSNRVLDLLDFELIKNNPKIFMWKSDIDMLNLVLNAKSDLITFHTPDIKIWRGREMDFDYSQKWFQKRLMEWEIWQIERNSEWTCLNEWVAEGKILWCNPEVILRLAWTKYFPDFQNSILFLEEEYIDNIGLIYCKLEQLRQIWIFDQIRWLVIWYIHGYQNEKILEQKPKVDINWNKVKFEDIVCDVVKDYNFPILKINEFGHYCPNTFLPIWAKVRLDAANKKIEIISEILL